MSKTTFLLWADRLPRPHPQFLGFPALKFVQTPHLQSAVMLISCTQSRGVYKGTARADFSAELLLTQPTVNRVFWFRSLALIPTIFLIVYLFVLPCVLPQPPPCARISSSSSPDSCPQPLTCSHGSFHGSTVFPAQFHGPSFAPTLRSPRSRSTARHSPVSRASLHLTPPRRIPSPSPLFVR